MIVAAVFVVVVAVQVAVVVAADAGVGKLHLEIHLSAVVVGKMLEKDKIKHFSN